MSFYLDMIKGSVSPMSTHSLTRDLSQHTPLTLVGGWRVCFSGGTGGGGGTAEWAPPARATAPRWLRSVLQQPPGLPPTPHAPNSPSVFLQGIESVVLSHRDDPKLRLAGSNTRSYCVLALFSSFVTGGWFGGKEQIMHLLTALAQVSCCPMFLSQVPTFLPVSFSSSC